MKHPVDVHVGKTIRHRRWMIGMTQTDLANACGIKFQQVQKYETGMNRVSASRLWHIAAALDVPVSHFFDGLDAASEAPEIDRGAAEIVAAYMAVDPEKRRSLLNIAKALAPVHQNNLAAE